MCLFLKQGGFGCWSQEDEEFKPFQDTGGKVRVLIIGMDYKYSPGNELTGSIDARHFSKLCQQAEVEDVKEMYDSVQDVGKHSSDFPTRENVIRELQAFGRRTRPQDYFVLFFAGHGENVPDHPPLDEEDGLDEAFVLPGLRGAKLDINMKHWYIDDQFVETIEASFHKSCQMLFIFDCCHSATLADIDSHQWAHRVISISACQDNEEATDTGRGGVLTRSLEKTIRDLAVSRGKTEYSVESVFDGALPYASRLGEGEQQIELQHANCNPALTPWPLPLPWWKLPNILT